VKFPVPSGGLEAETRHIPQFPWFSLGFPKPWHIRSILGDLPKFGDFRSTKIGPFLKLIPSLAKWRTQTIKKVPNMSNFHEFPLYKARIDWCVLKIGKRSFLGTDVLVTRPNFRAMVPVVPLVPWRDHSCYGCWVPKFMEDEVLNVLIDPPRS
jgi:hypothetical protein